MIWVRIIIALADIIASAAVIVSVFKRGKK